MRAVGIILAGGNSKRIKELSNERAIAALPVAGSYRSIDFALSNMTNSHIQRVGVLIQYNTRSLSEHLNSSKWWDFGRKQGGLFVFTPSITPWHSDWWRGTADALYQNIAFLKESHEPYVVIASGDGIYKMDFSKLLEYHIEKGADVTIVTKKLEDKEDISRFGAVKIAPDGRITDFSEKPILSNLDDISCGIYVVRRRLLIDLLEEANNEDRYDLVKDIFIRYKDYKKIYSYNLESYWSNIATVESYYKTNLDFLKKDVRNFFFKDHPDIHSRVDDLPPAKYNPGGDVKNSLIASGAIINGKVENSVISKKAYIGNGAIIKNSVLLNDVYVGDGAVIENCIVDGHSTILSNSKYLSEDGKIKIIKEKNERFRF